MMWQRYGPFWPLKTHAWFLYEILLYNCSLLNIITGFYMCFRSVSCFIFDRLDMEQEADRNNQGFSFYNRKADFGCRVIKTVALFLCWCCLGLYAEVLGPSLQTYIDVTNSNTEQIGTCLSMRELGMFFGSLVGAFLADRFVRWRHFVVAGGLVLGAVTIGAVPWCTTVASLSATLFFSGCAHGTMTASGNPLLNSIWLEKSGGPFNFMHSGYGVGASVAPGLLASFTFAQEKVFANGTVVKNRIISLTTPYFIVGGLCCGCACLFCCFSFCQPSKEVNPTF